MAIIKMCMQKSLLISQDQFPCKLVPQVDLIRASIVTIGHIQRVDDALQSTQLLVLIELPQRLLR